MQGTTKRILGCLVLAALPIGAPIQAEEVRPGVLRTPDAPLRQPRGLALRAELPAGRRHPPALYRRASAGDRRGPAGRRDPAPHPRRAHLGLPLPQDDPGFHRRRVPRRRPGSRRLRPFRQVRRRRRLQLPDAGGLHAGTGAGPRPHRRHLLRPGLGRTHRPARGHRGTRPVRARRGLQHRHAVGERACRAGSAIRSSSSPSGGKAP